MLNNKKLVVIIPAFNSEPTIARTVSDLPRDIVDEVLVVNDGSSDNTSEAAAAAGATVLEHDRNYGYGRSQKTAYREALLRGADIVVMIHGDYQYSPLLVVSLAGMIAYGEYDVAIGTRMLGRGALRGGMPMYKFISNRLLTFGENVIINTRVSEYHTGFRAFSREALEQLPFDACSDNFVFDNEMFAQVIYHRFRLGEMSCPTRYHSDASSVNFRQGVRYGLGVIRTALVFRLHRMRIIRSPIYESRPPQVPGDYYREFETGQKKALSERSFAGRQ